MREMIKNNSRKRWRGNIHTLRQLLQDKENEIERMNRESSDAKNKIKNLENNLNEYIHKSSCRGAWLSFTSISAIVLAFTAAYFGFIKDYTNTKEIVEETVQEQNEDNHFVEGKSSPPKFYFYSEFGSQHYVVFQDDNAIGMKGYLKNGNNVINMESGDANVHAKEFFLPNELLKKDTQFEVWAIDRNGNESEKKMFYTYAGFFSEQEVPR